MAGITFNKKEIGELVVRLITERLLPGQKVEMHNTLHDFGWDEPDRIWLAIQLSDELNCKIRLDDIDPLTIQQIIDLALQRAR